MERPERNRQLKLDLPRFEEDGFLEVSTLFSDTDVQRWRHECDRLWSAIDVDGTDSRVQWRDHVKDGRIADRLDPVMDISPEFETLSRDERLTGVAGALLGGEVTIFKGKLIMKRPGTSGYDLHQDYPYWDFLDIPPEHMIIVVIPIDPWDAESGAIEFFPGLHHERLPGPAGAPLDTDPSLVDPSTGVVMHLNPGDVGVFHPLTPHQSGRNTSSHERRSLYFTFSLRQYAGAYARYYGERPPYETLQRKSNAG